MTGSRPDAPPSFAFEVTSGNGVSVFQANGKMKVRSDRAVATVAAQVAPGRYSLRGAIVDGAGRAGSVELPITVGMRQAGDYQFSDLIVGTATDGFTPTARVSAPSVTAILELYAANAERFEGLTVDLQLTRGNDVLASAGTKMTTTSFAQQRIAEGVIRMPYAGSGSYQVVAVVKLNGRPVAQLMRPVAHCGGGGPGFAFCSPMATSRTNDTGEPGLRRDPDEWKTGDEPMTAAQRSYLETLSAETGETFDETLTKADASKRIDELRQRSPRLAEE